MLTGSLMTVLGALTMPLAVDAHPVLPVTVDPGQLDGYLERVKPLLDMPEADLLKLVPTQSGLYFCDCVHCEFGRQEGQFAHESGSEFVPWSVEEPDVLRCKHCGHEYPSEEYTENGSLEVTNPRGEVQSYPYYEDADGYRHHFAARLDYHKIRYMELSANTLARIYALTEEARYARLAGLIMHRFAEVYPGYCYHYDYPFQEKVIYSGEVDPKDFRAGFRTARWSWWAYMDVSLELVQAYDCLRHWPGLAKMAGGKAIGMIEDDLFGHMVDFTLGFREPYSNMSPVLWRSVIYAGRVLDRPQYVAEAMKRFNRLQRSDSSTTGTGLRRRRATARRCADCSSLSAPRLRATSRQARARCGSTRPK